MRGQAGFSLVELVMAMILVSLVILPIASISPLVTAEQVQHDYLERALVTANAAMDQVTTIYNHPDSWQQAPMAWTFEGAGNWSTFCDPGTDPDCDPPKMLWRAWEVPVDDWFKQVQVDVCLDRDQNNTCEETTELLVWVNRLVSRRCPDSLNTNDSCPPSAP